MNEIDIIKITIVFISALATNVMPILENKEPNEKNEFLKYKELLIIIIRIIILIYSINLDWPLEMCLAISIIISILSKLFSNEKNEELL